MAAAPAGNTQATPHRRLQTRLNTRQRLTSLLQRPQRPRLSCLILGHLPRFFQSTTIHRPRYRPDQNRDQPRTQTPELDRTPRPTSAPLEPSSGNTAPTPPHYPEVTKRHRHTHLASTSCRRCANLRRSFRNDLRGRRTMTPTFRPVAYSRRLPLLEPPCPPPRPFA